MDFSAHVNLPPRQQESTLLSRVPTHTYAKCKISGQQPTQLHKEFPRIHDVGHSKKYDAHINFGQTAVEEKLILCCVLVSPLEKR